MIVEFVFVSIVGKTWATLCQPSDVWVGKTFSGPWNIKSEGFPGDSVVRAPHFH